MFLQNNFSQNHSEDYSYLDKYFENLKKLEFKKAHNINLENKSSVNELINLLTKIIADNGTSLISEMELKIKEFKVIKSNSKINNSLQNLIKGYLLLNYKKDRVNSFKYFRNACLIGLKAGNKPLIKYSLLSILHFYAEGSLQNDGKYKNHLNKYKELCEDGIDWLYYYNYKNKLYGQSKTYDENRKKSSNIEKSLIHKFDSLVATFKQQYKPLLFYYIQKGNSIIWEKPNLAEKFYLKAWNLTTNEKYYKTKKLSILFHFSRVSTKKNEHNKGLSYLKTAYSFINVNDSLDNIFYINAYKAGHFYNLKEYDSAFIYERKARFSSYNLNFQKHYTEVSKVREELNSKDKEIENLQLKQDNLEIENKRKQNSNFLIGSLLFILFGGTIGYLNLKNSRKKRLLALQQKELEKQKNITLIKEQELTTINAMVDGQEKERKRIAEDLHDNIGSVLATLKLHFENLKINREKKHFNQEELYQKTEGLIDETYKKVRSIAHAKNAGVIANQGLLVAIQMMAEKISSADKINIVVIDYGLDKPIDNSLEISVFRIVQELTTNIIKHAEATNATINLAHYDDHLNIIIEDNGKGFDINKINLKNGMGISSIKTRIEHLEGTFEIDSTLKKGTSTIINIPIS
ncbi:sensor histidine kinase [Lutibacter sp. Hel_I_33_5]|uniref:sensor histidine kinase n=1 Tax=Lutibacter sp. Hel_I_33_5 TaxID=1566289 RepID=UPI0016451C5A|nr:sensor histidine kinase [Lutibacter sp. Hel_I_33_5]